MRRLNAGCGKAIMPKAAGWDNLDITPGEGVDIVWNIQDTAGVPLDRINQYDFILLSHVFEHLTNPLQAMYNLWCMAKPGAKMIVRCPWGGSHIAFEDPTHVRAVFLQTMHYYSQVAYNAADYGYQGDWHLERQILVLDDKFQAIDDLDTLHEMAMTSWNVGLELISIMSCVKPARPAGCPGEGYKLELVFAHQLDQDDEGANKMVELH